ncbi:hypothetical protein PTTG_29134 [Puccinia triticina 1-1 BBBD Race 1]|uniref:FAR1 domain-containing protein n=1 Tax=Puccinia triticina (isolate 1-1 / race 1 (BBBD)) TaxID=630390 RepID=A0A180G8C7_PUCT1|nr:hypothetical protein PTTG_29134 [Puccinia triticina 1-1 BBBD Race 1]
MRMKVGPPADQQFSTKSDYTDPATNNTNNPTPKNNFNSAEILLITKINEYDFKIGKVLDPTLSAQFLSMEDLFQFCQKWAKHHGYAVAKMHLVPGKNIYTCCNRSVSYCGSTLNNAGKKMSLSKVNCPFQLKGSIPTSKKKPNKMWNLEIRNAEHNHK